MALRDAERDRADAATERHRAGADLTVSQLLFANADRHEREAQEAADRDWNTRDLEGIASIDPNTRDQERKQAAEATDQARLERGSGELEYDNSERRERFAASLGGKANQKTIDARILAEGENAKHPREAALSQSGKAAKPHRSSESCVHQHHHGGPGRRQYLGATNCGALL